MRVTFDREVVLLRGAKVLEPEIEAGAPARIRLISSPIRAPSSRASSRCRCRASSPAARWTSISRPATRWSARWRPRTTSPSSWRCCPTRPTTRRASSRRSGSGERRGVLRGKVASRLPGRDGHAAPELRIRRARDLRRAGAGAGGPQALPGRERLRERHGPAYPPLSPPVSRLSLPRPLHLATHEHRALFCPFPIASPPRRPLSAQAPRRRRRRRGARGAARPTRWARAASESPIGFEDLEAAGSHRRQRGLERRRARRADRSARRRRCPTRRPSGAPWCCRTGTVLLGTGNEGKIYSVSGGRVALSVGHRPGRWANKRARARARWRRRSRTFPEGQALPPAARFGGRLDRGAGCGETKSGIFATCFGFGFGRSASMRLQIFLWAPAPWSSRGRPRPCRG